MRERTRIKELTKIDLEGLKDRIISLPIDVANYWKITAVGDSVYYMKMEDMNQAASLMLFDLVQREIDLGKIDGYEISADQKRIIVTNDSSYVLLDLPKAPFKIDKRLNLSDIYDR